MDVIDWLLDSDPAIRHQVLRDLLDADPEAVAAERARVAHEGWGSWLLALQSPDGSWDGGTYRPAWAPDDRPFFSAWTATHFSGPDPEVSLSQVDLASGVSSFKYPISKKILFGLNVTF